MLYIIYAQDNANSLALRQQARPAHLARLQALADQNRLHIAGPMPAIDSDNPGDAGFTGSMIVAEFTSLDAATQWANDDPYLAAGVYQSVDVRPFKKVF